MNNKRYRKNQLAVRKNLSGNKYIDSDIRGVDFSNCDLFDTDFTNALAGQKLHWKIVIVIGLVVSLCIAALITGLGGGFLASIITGVNGLIKTNHQLNTFIVYGIPSFIVMAGLTWMITSKKYGSGALGGVLIFIVAMIILILLSKENGELWLFAILVIFLATAAAFSGAIIASAVIATWNTLFSEHRDFLLALPFLVIALAGSYISMYVGKLAIAKDMQIIGFTICGVTTANILWVSYYIGRKAAFLTDGRYHSIYRFSRAVASIGGTKFQNADLTNANFTNATLKNSDFRETKLKHVCWYNVKQLEFSRLDLTYLENPILRNLVISKEAVGTNFDRLDMSELNLENANLSECSFISSDLSEAHLRNANLSKAKLVKTQLYAANLSNACLTGAFIQDWAIATDTNFENIQCDYVYMRLPTVDNPDAWRKPDNRNETFKENDFSDFIAPIVKTLDFYRQPNVDPRDIADSFKTLDLYHHHGIDPSAASIALKHLAKNHPDTVLEVVALEGRGNEKIRLQALVSGDASPSDLSEEYFEQYKQVSALPYNDIQKLLTSVAEKDDRIHSLEEMVKTAIQGQKFYIETQYSMGDINTNQLKEDSKENSDLPIKTILILAANPIDTKDLRLDEEVRELQKGLERAKKRDSFRIEQRWAVTPMDVRRALLDVKPQIVHFSGHGVGKVKDNQSRSLDIDLNETEYNEGLILENESGRQQPVSSQVLAELFSLFADHIECIIMNSCFSETQADAIVEYIPHVIGMKKAIGDPAALKFSVGFYDSLLAGNTVDFSFKVGCNAIRLAGIPEHLTPVLKKNALIK